MGTKKLKKTITVKPLSATMKALAASLDTLKKECIQWEQGAFKTANEGLYLLLSKCHAKYMTDYLSASEEDQEALIAQLKADLKADGIEMQANSPHLTVFVRSVFRTDRTRSFTYAKTIKVAIAANVKPEDLPAYIEEQGGIQAMKLSPVGQEKKAEAKAALADMQETVTGVLEVNSTKPLGKVVFESPSKGIVLMLGEAGANDKEVNVLGKLDNVDASILNYFKTEMAKVEIANLKTASEAAAAQQGSDIYAQAHKELSDIGSKAAPAETAEVEAALV